MKSLLVSQNYFPPQVGGISQYMAAIANALGPKRVCCLTAVRKSQIGVPSSIEARVYRRPAAFGKVRSLHALAWGATVGEIMIKERPQVVQLATADEGYIGLWLRRWLRLPFVVYAHGNEILNAIRSDWEKPRLALRTADRVLANSRFTADLVRNAGVDSNRIEVVHLGCDVNQFRPLPPNLELRQKLLGSRITNQVILTVGNLVPRKGHDMVIRALPRLRETIPDITYLIVGDGPNRSHLEALAETVGLRDRVTFAGSVPGRNLPDIYALCDVFVMPSRERLDECDVEGFGLVFLEANACAKPVVGGRSGGIPDAIDDGITGLLVTPDDPEDISNALARLLRDKVLARQLGEQGRSRAVREFNWSRIAASVQAALECVAQERSFQDRVS